MKLGDPDREWIRKILADLERNRSDPQIAALIDGHTSDRSNFDPGNFAHAAESAPGIDAVAPLGARDRY